VDQQALVEYRYQAVYEVLGGAPIGEVAVRYRTTRQSLDGWRRRFRQEGMPGLVDRSRRPHTSPNRLDAETEALICQIRREHPRWGARRINHELALRGSVRVPAPATVHRVLSRNGMIASLFRPNGPTSLDIAGSVDAGELSSPTLRKAGDHNIVEPGQAIEVNRTVNKGGHVTIAGHHQLIGVAWAGRTITLRLDGHLMHAFADAAVIGTWPSPVRQGQLGRVRGARTLPPAPLPTGALRAQRRVHESGRILIAGQRIKLGPRHRGKLVTVVEDTHLRILQGDEEIAVRPRRTAKPISA
jgi:transposase